MKRPFAPKKLIDSIDNVFLPAPELERWVKATFLNEDSKLFNEDHLHLRFAKIGYLWTNAKNTKQMKTVVGTMEIPKPPTISNAWQKARYYQQIRDWFGTDKLDFLMTLDARYLNNVPNIDFCATIDHKLYHGGQKLDAFGAPMFTKQGKPKYALLGHDLEEFVGIWRRYGYEAGAGDSIAFAEALKEKPTIGKAEIKAGCGNCLM